MRIEVDILDTFLSTNGQKQTYLTIASRRRVVELHRSFFVLSIHLFRLSYISYR